MQHHRVQTSAMARGSRALPGSAGSSWRLSNAAGGILVTKGVVLAFQTWFWSFLKRSIDIRLFFAAMRASLWHEPNMSNCPNVEWLATETCCSSVAKIPWGSQVRSAVGCREFFRMASPNTFYIILYHFIIVSQ